MNYHTTIPKSGEGQAQVLKDKLTPKAIVAALNEHIVGQDDAKKAVAVALRNRWRRQQLSPELRDDTAKPATVPGTGLVFSLETGRCISGICSR